MRALIVLLSSVAFGAWGLARADEVVLRNGDRLSGVVLDKGADTLRLKTDYAGELKIRWSEVATIRTAAPVELMLSEERIERLELESAQAGSTRLRTPGGAAAGELALERILYINPGPELSGRGAAYSGHISLGASVASGNSDNRNVYGDGEVKARARSYRWSLAGIARRAESDGVKSEEKWQVLGDYNWLRGSRRFVYARSSLEHDEFGDVDLRATLGGGYGLRLYDTDALQMSVEGGLDYVSVSRTAGEDEEYPAGGWGVRYQQAFWDGAMVLSHDQQGFLSLEDVGNVLVRTRTALRFPLGNGFETKAQLNVDWDNDPAPGRESVDSLWLLTVGYRW